MTVIRPNSISGVTSITALANEINVFKHDGVLAGLQLNGVNHHTSSGVSTFHTLNVLGNVSVGGTLTYQDVTNVDSLGIGTFRTGINVSGGQLDVGNNIKIGNAGVITATSFVGSGANLTGITAGLSNIVEDTSPQLGGNLDTNSKNIVFGDSSGTTVNRLTFGGQADMKLFHDGTNSVITNATGDLYINNNADTIIKPANDCFIKPQDGENGISVIGNGAVELYNNNARRLYTRSNGITVQGNSSGAGIDFSTDTTHRASVFANNAGEIGFLDTNGNFRLRVTGTTDVQCFNHFNPSSNNTYDLGSTSLRWRNIYTADLHCSNKGSSNDVDGTWGDYTIQEGESDLFLINNRNGKKYKFNLTEVS